MFEEEDCDEYDDDDDPEWIAYQEEQRKYFNRFYIWFQDLSPWLWCILFWVVFTLAMLGINAISCSKQALAMELPYKFELFSGCLVQYEDKWIPIKQILITIVK